MAKGYLNIKQLESMKKEDLQELANKLGVSDDGTKKQLETRIAEIEVDIPEESELTEEEKAAAEQQQAEPEEQVRADETERGKARVKAVTRYLDKQLNQIKDVGEEFTVNIERAAMLVAAAVVEIVK